MKSRIFAIVAIWFGAGIGNLVAVNIDWQTVSNPSNAADTTGYGAVAYVYRISRNEVTNSQYVEFLNAVAATDAKALYNANMGSNPRGGIIQSGISGSFNYSVKPDMGDKPVNFVSHLDAQRFSNWMHNGQGGGSTETGAYTVGSLAIHNSNATIWLPTENEWYKAAYYDPSLNAGGGGYWLYPTRSNTLPTLATANAAGVIANPAANVVNYLSGADWNAQNGNVTSVGSAGALSASFYGTFDQGGNVWEWNEAIISGSARGLRGGAWGVTDTDLRSTHVGFNSPSLEGHDTGFRLATTGPPEIGVTQANTALTDGISVVKLGGVTLGNAGEVKTFTVTNNGFSSLANMVLTKDGTGASDFTVSALGNTTLPPGGGTSFTITFTPSSTEVVNASLHISSNVSSSTIPFDFNLMGLQLSPNLDSDGDGMNDAAEFQMNSLGFDWQVNQVSLVSTYYASANTANLFSLSQVQALNMGAPLLVKDQASGMFRLTIGVQKSLDLIHYTPFPIASPQTSINTLGNIEILFSSPDDAAFFRLKSQ